MRFKKALSFFCQIQILTVFCVIAAQGQAILSGQLIYSRAPGGLVDNNSGTVWAVNPDGTGDHQITNGDLPRLSADGRYLIFRRKYSFGGSPNYQGSLWIRNMVTGTESEIYGNSTDYITGFDFSKSGQKIFLDWGCIMVVMDFDGSNRQNIGNNCYDDAPTQRASDGLLTFHGFGGEIYTSNADGSNRQAVPTTYGNNYGPQWSHNGQFIFYPHYDGSSGYPYQFDSIYRINPDGTGKVLIKSLTGSDRFAAGSFSSADDSIIYAPALIGGVSGIYAIATDGSGTVNFTRISQSLIASGSYVDFVGGIAAFNPSAASVSVGGRVISATGARIGNARVALSDQSGRIRTSITNPFGYYEFSDVAAGETYIVSVSGSKRYSFDRPTLTVTVSDEITDLDFIAN